MGIVVEVAGAVGGIGTSSLAWAIALQRPGSAVCIDAQPDGAPLDVLVGAETAPGTRWSQVHIASREIDGSVIHEALPEHCGVRVLSADAEGVASAVPLEHIVEQLRPVVDLVVIDAPLRAGRERTWHPDLHVVLLPLTLSGIAGVVTGLRSDSRLVIAQTKSAALAATELPRLLPNVCVGTVRRQQEVHEALRAGVAPGMTTDLMRVAASVVNAP